MDLRRRVNHKKMICSFEDHFLSLWTRKSQTQYDHIASINPTSLFDYFPEVKAMANNPDCVGPVSDGVWKAIDDGFENAVKVLAKEVEDNCAAMMYKAYQGAETSKPISSDNSTPANDTIHPILLRATSLFKYEDHVGKMTSYAGILKLRAEFSRYREHWRVNWKDGLEVPTGIIDTASALLRHMGLSETSSMLSLENLGAAFRL